MNRASAADSLPDGHRKLLSGLIFLIVTPSGGICISSVIRKTFP
jgi:hypothetical protein